MMQPPKITIGRSIKLPKGSSIFQEGDSGKEMYVVSSGEVRIFISGRNRSLTLSCLHRGDFFGEMAILEDQPRSASAEALTDIELVALSQSDFVFLVQQHPEIAMKVLGRFSHRLRDANHLIELLLLGDLTGNIIHYLVKMALTQSGSNTRLPREWFLPVDLSSLSAELAVNSEELSVVLNELERMGIIIRADEGIIIKKHKKLKYYLEYLEWKTGI